MSKIILATGGTGGHIFPAIAVGKELRKRGHLLLFIGSLYGREKDLVQKAGLPFAGLPARGFLGRGWRSIPATWNMLQAVIKASGIIRKFRPDVVAGFGGYASFAPLLAANFLHIPTLLQEQNAIGGASNRFLSRFARTVCVSLPGTKGFSGNVIVTGNPSREEIAALCKREERDTARLLVLGGSQGAHALNVFMPTILDSLKNVEILHQSGPRDLEQTRSEYERHGRDGECVQPFIDDMAKAYAWADVAICRSGASTVAELALAGLPSILVPFPAAIHDHQTVNARFLAHAGAAFLVPETDLKAERTSAMLMEIFKDKNKREAMGKAARALAKADATARVADEIEKIRINK